MSQEFKNTLAEMGSEAKRMAPQGCMETASPLFNRHGFVPNGPGQYTPSTDLPKEQSPTREPMQQQIARGGMV